MAVHRRPVDERIRKPILEYRPFLRIQIDLMEVRPKSEEGFTHVLTVCCVATRYVFFRNMQTRDSSDIAEQLLDCILHCGVVPRVIQGDQEFVNLVLDELCSLLGSSQIFSTALRPQTQGINERQHREIRETLSILVDSLSRALARKWPRFMRWIESRLRHKKLPSGKTPYELVHGFVGSSALKYSLEAFSEIPEELAGTAWFSAIVHEAKVVMSVTAEVYEDLAKKTLRESKETSRVIHLSVGDLVLLQKPFYEKGAGMILPQCSGPCAVDRVFLSTVQLSDPLTGELVMNGKGVAKSRLVKFEYPAEYAQDGSLPDPQGARYATGDFVMFRLPGSGLKPKVHVGMVERFFAVGSLVHLVVYEVPKGERYGPWERRPWRALESLAGGPETITIEVAELVCKVDLKDSCLTADSLGTLASLGVYTKEPTMEKAF